ncbi:MAG: HAMP domain-containing histidine kinase [Alphaproteobacteria bacterium]|nr:HAMP domain-containing histidine kinase [Alphaproteobacteria bacterium]
MDLDNAASPSEENAQARNAKLAVDQMDLALRNLSFDHWIMPTFAAILCVMFLRWVEPVWLIVWFAAVTASVVPFTVITRIFRRRRAAHRQRWLWAVTAGYAGSAIGWSSLAYFLWVPHNDLNHMVILLVLACTIAGSSALVSASTPMAWVSFGTYGAAMVLAPLQEPGLLYAGGSLLALLFVTYLFHMSRQVHATARDMLLLRNDKNDLIVALAQAKNESDEARSRAEAASVAKSQFLANMSHELRTPLNAILGFSEIISNSALQGDVAKHHEYADLIHRSGGHLLTLINDILDLAKIEAGKFVLHDAELDLDHMIDDSHMLVATKADAGKCLLVKQVEAGLPNLYADERAIRQILLNLLSNALKFTPPGGTVTSFARAEKDGGITFGVQDTGVGIAKDDIAKVFQKFGQGRHDIVTMDKGTGLGLPIVKGLAEAHGGTVTLKSELGSGTTVTVRLPASRTHAKTLRAAS